jgi:hypothetical protein
MSSRSSWFFAFESDMERSLSYIPMAVRFKLDKCGVKISLDQWHRLPQPNREYFLRGRCNSASEIATYRRALCNAIKSMTGEEPCSIETNTNPPWNDPELPNTVRKKALELELAVPTPFQWRNLTELQRFALVKLSHDGNHHRNLIPALREFALL